MLAAALWFRVAVVVSPLNEATIGTLWTYDYRAAVNAAAGFGFVHDAPPDRRQLTPLSVPVPLTAIARSFEPLQLDEQPYHTTFRMPGYSAASALAMRVTGTTSVQPLIDLQLILDSLVPPGWNDDYLEGPVQFRMLLRASADGRRAPLVSHIRLR